VHCQWQVFQYLIIERKAFSHAKIVLDSGGRGVWEYSWISTLFHQRLIHNYFFSENLRTGFKVVSKSTTTG